MFDNQSFERVIGGGFRIFSLTKDALQTKVEKAGSLFLLRNCLSGLTFYRILHPTTIPAFPEIVSKNIHDFPTANVIVRTMFEAYINMYYVLIEPIGNEEERNFRLDLWCRHKLSEISKMGKQFSSNYSQFEEKNKEVLLQTETKLKEVDERIKSSKLFENLPDVDQKTLKNKDNWKIGNATDLAEKSGFDRSQANFLYKFLSNYTHSEAYSQMQVPATLIPNESKELLNGLPRAYTEVILALTLNAYGKLSSPAREQIDADNDLVEIIGFCERMKGLSFDEFSHEAEQTNLVSTPT